MHELRMRKLPPPVPFETSFRNPPLKRRPHEGISDPDFRPWPRPKRWRACGTTRINEGLPAGFCRFAKSTRPYRTPQRQTNNRPASAAEQGPTNSIEKQFADAGRRGQGDPELVETGEVGRRRHQARREAAFPEHAKRNADAAGEQIVDTVNDFAFVPQIVA